MSDATLRRALWVWFRPMGAVGVVLLVLGLAPGCCLFEMEFAKSVDAPRGTIALAGTTAEIVIRRDELGVPYIEAQNEDDLVFGAGYVAAEDRLWQMVTMTMAMQGRMAEIAGADMLKLDLFLRSLHARRYVEQAMQTMDAQTRQALTAYARGVNAYLERHPHLPAEFVLTGYRPEPWRPEDTFYVFCMLNLGVSANLIEELGFLLLAQRLGYEKAAWLFPVYPDEGIPFAEAAKLKEIPAERLLRGETALRDLRREMRGGLALGLPASNNWAVAGKRTASGRPLVANDTHLLLSVPNAWMLMHLKCPTYEAAGVTVPGFPSVTLGCNGKVAWGATMVMADSQDLFVEKLREEGGRAEYLYRGEWLPVIERKERFGIKGKKPVEMVLLETRHGPLLNRALEEMPLPPEMAVQPMPMKSEYGLALRWAVEGMPESVKAFYELGKTRNVAEARQVAQRVQAIYLNLVFGDRESIGWQVTGAFPLRAKGKGMLPAPGWTGEYEWTGFLHPAQNPGVVDPAEGFIATANNRTVPKDYPYQLTSSWAPPERRERVAGVLGKLEQASVADMLNLQGEHYSLMAEKVQRLLFTEPLQGKLAARIEGWTDEGRRARALEALQWLTPHRFHPVLAPQSGGAAVMGAFMHCFARELFLDELGGEGSPCWEAFLDFNLMSYPAPEDHLFCRPDSPFWDNVRTGEVEPREEIIGQALQKAVLLLEERIGRDRQAWQWGKLHTYHWRHDFTKKTALFHAYFNRGPYAAGGDSHALNVTCFPWGGGFDVLAIPAMRMVADFGSAEPLWFSMTPGQSGNPSSPHYGDMIPGFLAAEGRRMPFGKERVEQQYRDVLRILPAQGGSGGK